MLSATAAAVPIENNSVSVCEKVNNRKSLGEEAFELQQHLVPDTGPRGGDDFGIKFIVFAFEIINAIRLMHATAVDHPLLRTCIHTCMME